MSIIVRDRPRENFFEKALAGADSARNDRISCHGHPETAAKRTRPVPSIPEGRIYAERFSARTGQIAPLPAQLVAQSGEFLFPGISVFYKDANGTIFHTYSCYARGLDLMNGAYNCLDLVPKGRDEEGLQHPMAWVRRHDEYED